MKHGRLLKTTRGDVGLISVAHAARLLCHGGSWLTASAAISWSANSNLPSLKLCSSSWPEASARFCRCHRCWRGVVRAGRRIAGHLRPPPFYVSASVRRCMLPRTATPPAPPSARIGGARLAFRPDPEREHAERVSTIVARRSSVAHGLRGPDCRSVHSDGTLQSGVRAWRHGSVFANLVRAASRSPA